MPEFIAVLKALADETRLKIINLLLNHDYCVGALARRLNISEAAVSQHLQILRKSGLAKGEKRGYYTHYSIDRAVLTGTAQKVTEMALQTPVCKSSCRKHQNGGHQYCGKEE